MCVCVRVCVCVCVCELLPCVCWLVVCIRCLLVVRVLQDYFEHADTNEVTVCVSYMWCVSEWSMYLCLHFVDRTVRIQCEGGPIRSEWYGTQSGWPCLAYSIHVLL